jgi:uncharacterized protein involved in exopolysaccharide biosynthesis
LDTALATLKGLSREARRNALPVQFSDAQLVDLMQRKAAAEHELVAAGKEKTEKHPDVQRLQTLLSQINAQIEGRLEACLESRHDLQSRLGTLNRAVPVAPVFQPAGWPTGKSALQEVHGELLVPFGPAHRP